MVLVKLLSKFRVQKKDSGGDRVRSGEISAGFPRLLEHTALAMETAEVRVPLSKGREREGNEQIAVGVSNVWEASKERADKGERGAIFNPPNEFHISHSAAAPRPSCEVGATRNETLPREEGGKEGGGALFRRVKIGHEEA